MAVTYGFFNSVNGDRKYNAEQMSEYFRGIVNEGVFQHLDGGLAVTAGTGLAVIVASGRAIIQNRWVQNSDTMTLSISAASETYARKDAVVVRLNYSTRSIEIAVKAGTPAASPVAPSMTRNSTTYEMALAYVNVAANATSVTVTDKRSDSTVCGWVTVAQSTSGEVDAQLNAMKTGFDGVVYGSPVEMVTGEDQKLQNRIDEVVLADGRLSKQSVNITDIISSTKWENKVIQYANPTYIRNPSTKAISTDLFTIEKETDYLLIFSSKVSLNLLACFYNSDGTYNSQSNNTGITSKYFIMHPGEKVGLCFYDSNAIDPTLLANVSFEVVNISSDEEKLISKNMLLEKNNLGLLEWNCYKTWSNNALVDNRSGFVSKPYYATFETKILVKLKELSSQSGCSIGTYTDSTGTTLKQVIGSYQGGRDCYAVIPKGEYYWISPAILPYIDFYKLAANFKADMYYSNGFPFFVFNYGSVNAHYVVSSSKKLMTSSLFEGNGNEYAIGSTNSFYVGVWSFDKNTFEETTEKAFNTSTGNVILKKDKLYCICISKNLSADMTYEDTQNLVITKISDGSSDSFDVDIDQPIIPTELYLSDDAPTRLHKSSMFLYPYRTCGLTMSTYPNGRLNCIDIGDPASLKYEDVGSTAKITLRKPSDFSRNIYADIKINKAAADSKDGDTFNLLMIGDSITHGDNGAQSSPIVKMNSLLPERYGITPTMIGTFAPYSVPGEGRGVFNFKVMAGMESMPYGNTYNFVSYGGNLEQSGTHTTTQFQNPFTFPATSNDLSNHPELCFTNKSNYPSEPDGLSYEDSTAEQKASCHYFIFDFARYLALFGGQTVPDVITIALGTNDWWQTGINIDLEKTMTAFEIIYSGIRAAAPNAVIGVVTANPIATTLQGDGRGDWVNEIAPLAYRLQRKILEYQGDGDTKIHEIPLYACACRWLAFDGNTAGTPDYMNTYNTAYEQTIDGNVHLLDGVGSDVYWEYMDALATAIFNLA